jgi:NAD+ synthase (glutamine-hydrolysing)
MVGGQDELVFDGDSLVVDRYGHLLARAPLFDEGLLVVDLDLPEGTADHVGPFPASDGTTMYLERTTVSTTPVPAYTPIEAGIASRADDCAEVYAALVLGTRDYVRKNDFQTVVLGLSGGIDSALVATIAADALGPESVHTVAMPSRYSSEHSIADAAELVRRQGIHFQVVPIGPMVDAYEKEVELHGLAAENLQARVRGTTLMALSNENSITKPPSAELRPGQLDIDSLPPYEKLDAILEDYVERDLGREALLAAGHDAVLVDRIIRLVDAAEYKRRQYPPGPKISLRAFGRDRRLPITNRWREHPTP